MIIVERFVTVITKCFLIIVSSERYCIYLAVKCPLNFLFEVSGGIKHLL